jgi:hypothetical protein
MRRRELVLAMGAAAINVVPVMIGPPARTNDTSALSLLARTCRRCGPGSIRRRSRRRVYVAADDVR